MGPCLCYPSHPILSGLELVYNIHRCLVTTWLDCFPTSTTTSLADKRASAWIFLSLLSHLPTAVGPSFIICFCWGAGGAADQLVEAPPSRMLSVCLLPPPCQWYLGAHLASLGSESLTKQLYFSRTCFLFLPLPHSPPELSIPIHHGSLEENGVSSQQLFRMHLGPE